MLFLKDLRKEMGMTQTEVAKLIGCSRQSYNAYENGYRSPDPDLPSVETIEAFLLSVSELSKQPPEVQKQIINKVCEKIKKDGTQFEVEFRLSMVAGDRNRPRTKYTILI